MAGTSALYSKLRILVAKLYKAEKLYASMSNVGRGSSPLSDTSSFESLHSRHRSAGARHPAVLKQSRSQKSTQVKEDSPEIFTSAILIEYANEVRSVEWYRVHNDYRCKLNDIFSAGSSSSLPLKLNKLWHDFVNEFAEAEKGFLKVRDEGRDALEREEYTYLLRVSAELVRRRSRLQALKVIHDELESLISPEQRLKGSIFIEEEQVPIEHVQGSNLIPLKRRIAR